MFTGLIQEKGKLTRIIPRGRTILLTCRASKKLLADYQIGDSMAINGVCLTAVKNQSRNLRLKLCQKRISERRFQRQKYLTK